jgi:hypothetical protein
MSSRRAVLTRPTVTLRDGPGFLHQPRERSFRGWGVLWGVSRLDPIPEHKLLAHARPEDGTDLYHLHLLIWRDGWNGGWSIRRVRAEAFVENCAGLLPIHYATPLAHKVPQGLPTRFQPFAGLEVVGLPV